MICIKSNECRWVFPNYALNLLIKKENNGPSQNGVFALFGLLALTGALLFVGAADALEVSPAARLHLFTALGLVPLILGAMGHFVPVLTRTAPESSDTRPAYLALTAGIITLIGLQFWFPAVYFAALIGLLAAADSVRNIYRRSRNMLGSPHPSIHWYTAALGAFLFALLAVLAGYFAPAHWLWLRTLHLHLNLMGFAAITALGTLQVLLPTAGGFSDSGAVARLRRDLPWVVFGTLLIAVGATVRPELGWFGVALWLYPLARFLAAMLRYRTSIFHWRGAAISLFSAGVGLAVILLIAVFQHATEPASGYRLLILMVSLFFIPLISGALTQLLPVWLDTTYREASRQSLRRTLGYGAGVRVGLLWLGAGGIALGYSAGLWMVAVVLAVFLLQIGAALYRRFRQ